MAEALYRKYRPQIFEDVIGQEPIARTLKNAIAQDKLSHAYLLCGPRGTGKTTTARLIAKALLCEHGPTPDPDGTCEDCRMIADGVHPDVYELDAASRTGVENVREEIISRVQFAPTRGRYKVYVIDEVHMLSTAAFNALLKTLEEPPDHVVFVLCTTDPQKVPDTIQSRCQRFDFHRISAEAMVSRLGAICVSEGVEFEGEALDLIAHRADGGMRNALTSIEQIIAFENGRVTLKGAELILGAVDSNDMADIIRAIGTRDVAACFRWVADYVEAGSDLVQFVRDMTEHVRNMYVLAMAGDDIDLNIPETTRRELVEERQWFGEDRLSRMLGVLGDLSVELKDSSNQRLSFEIALTRMVRPDSDLTIAALAERVEALESGYSAVAHVVSEAPQVRAAAPAAKLAQAAPRSFDAARQGAEPSSAPQAEPGGEELSDAQIKLRELQRERIYKREQERQEAWRGGSSAQPKAVQEAQPSQQKPAAPVQPAPVRAVPPAPAPAAASAPAASAAPAAASSSGSATFKNPAALQRVWQAALASLKKQKAAYSVLFMNTKIAFGESDASLTITFPQENAFAFKSVQRSEVREALSAALAQAAGAPIAFTYAQGPAGAQSFAAAQAPARTPAPAPAVPARPQPQPAPAPAPVAAPAPAPYDEPARYDDYVPYEDEPVPYGDDAAPYDDVPPYDDAPFIEGDRRQPDRMGDGQEQRDRSDEGALASSAPSDGVPADLQAMLQAGFGGGVRIEEV